KACVDFKGKYRQQKKDINVRTLTNHELNYNKIRSLKTSHKYLTRSIVASALTAIGINVLIGEQYLSILLTGETYQAQYKKVGLDAINLSRVSEDAGTVVNPVVPWSVCGVFITKVLEVPTVAYLPFAFFCLLTPILTILFGITGRTLTYTTSKH